MAWLAGEPSRLGALGAWMSGSDALVAAGCAQTMGNVATRLMHAPNATAARERFARQHRGKGDDAGALYFGPRSGVATAAAGVRRRLAFLVHGLEFARVQRAGRRRRVVQPGGSRLRWGLGANESALTEENAAGAWGRWLRALCARRSNRRARNGMCCTGCSRSAGWKENVRQAMCRGWIRSAGCGAVCLSAGGGVCGGRSGNAGSALAFPRMGRLAVIELKAEDDPHLALQGLGLLDSGCDGIMRRIRDRESGLGEFQRHAGILAEIGLSGA